MGRGQKKSSVVVEPGLQVDLRMVEEESYGAMLHMNPPLCRYADYSATASCTHPTVSRM